MNRLFAIFLFLFYFLSSAQESSDVEIRNLEINSKNNEFYFIPVNFNTAYFLTSPLKKHTGIPEQNAKMYAAKISENHEINHPVYFPEEAKSLCFTKDGKTVYFSKEVGGLFQLFKAEVDKNGRWKHKIKLPVSLPNYHYKHPALNPSENKLFFASNRAGTYGGFDIFYINLSDELPTKLEPVQLSTKVNSKKNELYPSVGKNDLLYFSSNRSGGMGGYDIYSSKLENQVYRKAQNKGKPFNSSKDDIAFIPTGSSKGYFSSNRIDGFGGFDIYYFNNSNYNNSKPSSGDCTHDIYGVVKNKINKKTIPEVNIEIFSQEEHIETLLTDAKGEFHIENLDCKKRYDIVSYKEGFNGFAEVQTSPEVGKKIHLYLDPEFPEEYEEEFNFSDELVVIDTETKKVIQTAKVPSKKKELSFAERRERDRIAKEEKKRKELEAAREAERIRKQKEKEARIAAAEARKKAVEKQIKEREKQAQLLAEKLRKEKELAEQEAQKKAEEAIIAQEKEREAQAERQRIAKEKEAVAKAEEAKRVQEQKEAQAAAEKAKQLAEQQEKERIQAEKEAAIAARKKDLEAERQARIAKAKETAEKLRKEKELAEQEAQKKAEEAIIAQEKEREAQAERQRIAKEKEAVAKAEEAKRIQEQKEAQAAAEKAKQLAEQQEKERIQAEKEAAIAARKKALEAERQARIAKAKETAEKLRKEKELAEQEAQKKAEEAIIAQEKEREAQAVTENKDKNTNDGRCAENIDGVILQSTDNRPVPGANIDMYYDGQNIESITTDANGEFHFINVDCNTEYTLICFKKDYNNIAKAELNTANLPDQIVLLLEPDKEVATNIPVKEIEGAKPIETAVSHQVVAKTEKVPDIKSAQSENRHVEPETNTEVVTEKTATETKEKRGIESEKTETVAVQEIKSDKKPVAIKETETIASKNLPKIVGKKIQLEPIYFDLDEWYLTLPARRILDKLILLMHQNKSMIVESGSHTDSRGPFEYNLELSEKRSQEVVGYLIANGVDPDRISGRGYGETMPLNRCVDGVKCTEKEYLVNRRTEFVILKQ